jgi:sortase A
VKRRRPWRLGLAPAAILLAAGAGLVSWALYVPAKAALAQILLEQAWTRTQAGEAYAKPWPWADIAPIARIEIPRLEQHEIVLEGTNGSALAFGPGHMEDSATIGGRGTAIVAAHRDTQFRYLGKLVAGDSVVVTTAGGSRIAYRVAETHIVRADASGLDPTDNGPNGSRLALVTCYPFTGVLHSPWRYVVIADRDPDRISTNMSRPGLTGPASQRASAR